MSVYLYIGTHIYFQFHKTHLYLLSISQKTIQSTSKKLSMDPFDIEAYKQKRDIEDTYIVNRFIQRRKK